MNFRFLFSVIIRAVIFFIIANILVVAVDPLPALSQTSLYNNVFRGRERLPFGETPEQAYNFSLFNVEAMLLSHEIAGAKKEANEYRVILLGDSATWGTLLRNNETLAGYLNALQLSQEGKRVRVFNLGYPSMSLTKDLLILSLAKKYHPDLIVWAFTLESFPRTRQLASPLAANNPQLVRPLITQYALNLDLNNAQFINASWWDKTIIGQRRALADVFRLQLYGVLWTATNIDQYYPEKYQLRADDLPSDAEFYGLKSPKFSENDLALEVLDAGVKLIAPVPIIFVNEPMFISAGKNSEVRYNFFYPKWAYDDFRVMVNAHMKTKNWRYLDLWNVIAPSEFTNSAVHVTPKASRQTAERLAEFILAK